MKESLIILRKKKDKYMTKAELKEKVEELDKQVLGLSNMLLQNSPEFRNLVGNILDEIRYMITGGASQNFQLKQAINAILDYGCAIGNDNAVVNKFTTLESSRRGFESFINDFEKAFEVGIKCGKGEATIKEILSINNIELRRVAMASLDIENLLKDAELIGKSGRDNELYELNNIVPGFSKAFFLKYKDISTDRVYISGIAPGVIIEAREKNIKNLADYAMAWKFHWNSNEYKQLKDEA